MSGGPPRLQLPVDRDSGIQIPGAAVVAGAASTGGSDAVARSGTVASI
jgi:hypothetical protein